MSVLFQGPWHPKNKEMITNELAGLFEEHPQARVTIIDTGDYHDPFKANVWDGPVHKTVEPLTAYAIGPLIKQIFWCFAEEESKKSLDDSPWYTQ